MRFLAGIIAAGISLSGCRSAGQEVVAGQEWQPSSLSQQTQERVHAGLREYEKCLNNETRSHVNDRMDSRRVTDVILRNCEDALSAVKAAFDAEKVPDGYSERYLRGKRSRAAQQILRVVMATQAVQSPAVPR